MAAIFRAAAWLAAVGYLILCAWAMAGPFEEAEAAYERRDYSTALRLLRPLAAQGDANAQYTLGYMYMDGHGVVPNNAMAAHLFRLAGMQGLARAQRQLGILYAAGRGVDRNYVVAYMWLSLAVSGGDMLAREPRDDLATRMPPEQVAQAERLARDWRPPPPR